MENKPPSHQNPNQAKDKGIKQIKHYKLIREIGRGANGVVYEAEDTKLNKLVAIKSIPSDKLKDKRKMESFKRELKALYELKHPQIIKMLGIEKTVNNIYIILEYANSGNLYDLLLYYKKKHNSSVPERLVQQITKQIVDGLEYMHKRKMIHRDIKLENILLHFEPEHKKGNFSQHEETDFAGLIIKIADLGYARELDGTGVVSTICGTPIIMAPDVINIYYQHMNDQGFSSKPSNHNDRKYNEKADLWSLGAITYELLIGRPPFFAPDYETLFKKIMGGNYTLPKNLFISVEAITFINGLLTFNSDKRFGWDEILEHPFVKGDIENFHPLDLSEKDLSEDQVKVDTKDADNFLWLMYKNENLKNLDKIETKVLDDSELMKSIIVKKEDLSKEKLSLLGRFRQGAQASKTKESLKVSKPVESKDEKPETNLEETANLQKPITVIELKKRKPEEKEEIKIDEKPIQAETNGSEEQDSDHKDNKDLTFKQDQDQKPKDEENLENQNWDILSTYSITDMDIEQQKVEFEILDNSLEIEESYFSKQA